MRSKGTGCGVVVLLFVGAFAGCLSGDAEPESSQSIEARKLGSASLKFWTADDPALSQPLFPEILFEPFPLTASDGAKLDNWVYRPKTPDDVKVPTIIHLSPYFASGLPSGGGRFDKVFLRDLFAPRGYAVMMASVRGTGFSEGCFEIGGPRERQDYNELFQAVAKQPWSNGLVGLIGVSYDGTAPQGALIAASPHLKTIVPIAAISEWYKYNFIKGVQINPQGWAFNTYYVALEQVPLNIRNPLDPIQVVGDVVTYSSRVCPNQGSGNGIMRGPSLVDVQRAQVATAFTGTTDPYWEERNFTRYLDRVRPNVSVFVVHGLVDYNVKTHNLLPWYTELQSHGVPTKILLGQWPHAYPGTARPNGLKDWNVTLLRWFDYWLKDLPSGIMDEPNALIQDFAGVWRTEDNFPPSRVEPRVLYFDQGGKLSEAAGTGQSSFLDNGRPYDPNNAQGPQAVAFLTPKLEQEFRYSGEAVATVEISHSMPRGQIAVAVYNVTGGQWRPVNWGYYNYNIRNAPERYDPVMPSQRFTLQVPLLPTDMVIAAGSQMAVVLSGQSTGGPGMLPPPSAGTTTVFHGAKSFITFPSLDGIEPLVAQPAVLGPAPPPL